MHCTGCNYLLFNLTGRVCPECGLSFETTAYHFAPGSVAFHCPECDQEYSGNDAHGLPTPREFQCVQCNKSINVAEMRVSPIHANALGWIGSTWDNRKNVGFCVAWWTTFKQLLFQPGQFFAQHQGSSIYEAWVFSLPALFIGVAAAFLVHFLMMVGFTSLAGGGMMPGVPATPIPISLLRLAMVYVVMALIFPLFVQFMFGGFWACTTHPVLFMMAPERKSFKHTLCATFYSFAPYALMIVPICGGYAAYVWQAVILVIAIKQQHRVNGWVASLAVLWPIVAIMAIYMAIVAVVILGFAAGA